MPAKKQSAGPEPQTLVEAVRNFSDPDVCIAFVAGLRWPDGKPVCPHCGGLEHSFLTTRRIWKCRDCRKQFSAKVGTIFEDSPIGFDKWLPAIWMIANSKNGISSHELGRSLGVTQKSVWFMVHRIRLAMQTGTFARLSGTVEVDETFIGGKARDMHADVRARKVSGTGVVDKTAVLGFRQRGGAVRAEVVKERSAPTLQGRVRSTVEYTDSWRAYMGLGDEYHHATVDHAAQYVNGQDHTNGIESFWSLLKRGLK
jgi:transposase-like protein